MERRRCLSPLTPLSFLMDARYVVGFAIETRSDFSFRPARLARQLGAAWQLRRRRRNAFSPRCRRLVRW